MPIKSIPSTFGGETRRRVPYRSQAGKCSLKVPLLTDNPEGKIELGLVRVPASIAFAAKDTNDRHQRDRIITEQLRAWEEYRAKRGWKMVSPPKLSRPEDPPSATTVSDPLEADVKWIWATARFQRTSPLWVGLDDLLHQQDLAKLHGVTIDKDPLPWNDVSGDTDTGWMDPMKHAEERRQKLGVKRKDYIIPEAWSSEALEALNGH